MTDELDEEIERTRAELEALRRTSAERVQAAYGASIAALRAELEKLQQGVQEIEESTPLLEREVAVLKGTEAKLLRKAPKKR